MATSSSPAHQTPQQLLKDKLHQTANVVVSADDSIDGDDGVAGGGVFGELTDPQVVWSALQTISNPPNESRNLEGNQLVDDDPTVASARMALQSLSVLDTRSIGINNGNDICVEIDNLSLQFALTIRWMDERGHNDPQHFLWTIAPCSSWVQWTQAGHLMLISATSIATASTGEEEEFLLGSYRPWIRLPSGSPHSIMVQDQSQPQPQRQQRKPIPSFFLQSVLTDPTQEDAILVAAAALDPVRNNNNTKNNTKTRTILQTILHNILQHPLQNKYRRLRLANSKIQHYIACDWGAQHLLRVIGFREQQLDGNELYLVLPDHPPNDNSNNNNNNNNNRDDTLLLIRKALSWLDVLQQRAPQPTQHQQHFVAELAVPVPWQRPVVQQGANTNTNTNANTNTAQSGFRTRQGTHYYFVTPEERWARSERVNANRASGRARKPAPGEAPSSRGKWGR